MATYIGLPPVVVTATADQSGVNSGNWTNAFTSAVLGSLRMPFFELYHATVSGVPGGASAKIGLDATRLWGFTAPGVGGGAEYAPAAGWLLNPSMEFYFLWTAAATGTPVPQVTAWFRYDLDIPANKRAAGIVG